MVCLKHIQGEKTHAHSGQRKREENYNFKGKDLSLNGDLQEKRTLTCCGAVSKDVFSNYGVSWLEVQSTCIDFNGRKITQHCCNAPSFSLAIFLKFKTTDIERGAF